METFNINTNSYNKTRTTETGEFLHIETGDFLHTETGDFLQIDSKHDLWVYSVFYEFPNKQRSFHGLRAVGSFNTQRAAFTVHPTIHLLYTDGGTETVVGWHRALGGAGAYKEMVIECSLTPDQRPEWVTFSWPHNRTQTAGVKVVYPDTTHGRNVSLTTHRRNVSLCYSVLFGGFDDADLLQQNLEYNRELGVQHVTLYTQAVGARVTSLLAYYTHQGFVTSLPMPAVDVVRGSYYFGQNIALQDCFGRNRYVSKYVVMTDPDEFIVPVRHRGYTELLADIEERERQQGHTQPIAEFAFRHAFYCLTQLTDQQHQLVHANLSLVKEEEDYLRRHQVRLIMRQFRNPFMPFPRRQKSIYQPDHVVDAGTHFPKVVMPGASRVKVDESVAFLAHYRYCKNCGEGGKGGRGNKDKECTFHFNVSPVVRPFIDRLKQATLDYQAFLRGNNKTVG